VPALQTGRNTSFSGLFRS